jgi:PAS domain S-box-containing protein
MKRKGLFIVLALCTWAVVWVLDALFDTLIFFDQSFFEALISDVSGHEIFHRLSVWVCFSIFLYIFLRYLERGKNARTTLEESEEKHRTFIDNAQDGIAIFQDLYLKYVNPRLAEMLGYTVEEMLGTLATDYVPEAEIPRLLDLYERRMAGGNAPQIYETVLKGKNGEPVNVEVSAKVIDYEDKPADMVFYRDITERKRTEDELKKSVEHFRAIFENSLIGIYQTTPDGKILMANPSLVKMLGYETFEELAKRNLEKTGYEPRYPRSRFMERIERDGTVVGLESAWIKRDGKTLFVRESAKAVKDETGKVLYYDGVVEDITERMLAEEALRTSEERYRAFTEQARVGVYIYDDGRLLYANPEMERITGYPREELLQMDTRLMEVPDRQKTPQMWEEKRLQEDENCNHYLMHLLRKDGTIAVLEFQTHPIFYEGKRVTFGNCIDITEKRLAEEALAESEKRHRFLVENTHDLFYRVNLEDESYAYLSPALEKILGFKVEEFIEMAKSGEVAERIHPDDMPMLVADVEALRDNGRGALENPVIEYRLRHKDGGYRWLSDARKVVFDETGKATSIVGVSRDITERKRAEEALRKSENRFRNFFENEPAFCYMISSEGTIQDVNRAALEALGYEKEELIGAPLKTIYAPESQDKMETLFEKWHRTGELNNEELTIQAKDGTKRHVLLSATAIRDQDGKLLHSISVQRDITERKRAAEEIERQVKNLKVINELTIKLAAVPPEVNIYKLVGEELKRITGALAAAVTVYEPASNELIIKHLGLRRESLSKLEKLLKRRLLDMRFQVTEKMHNLMTTEVVARFEDISEMTFGKIPKSIAVGIKKAFGLGEIMGFTLRYGGEIVGTVGMFMPAGRALPPADLMYTFANVVAVALRRRKAEEALVESEERYRSIVETATEGIWILDAKARTTYVNKQMAQMLGYTTEQMRGRSFFEYTDPQAKKGAMGLFAKLKEGVGERRDLRFKRRDGSDLWTIVSSNPLLNGEGKVVGVLGMVADITERKWAEEEIKTALDEKEVLLREIHHRVKNNLQIISSLLYLGSLDLTEQRAVAAFRESQNRIKIMAHIHEMLYQSKGLGSIYLPAYLSDIVNSIFSSFSAELNSIDLDLSITESHLGIDTAVPLGLVVNELVSNSIEHAFPNGKGRIFIDLKRSGDGLFTVRIGDDGVGLPEGLDIKNSKTLGLKLVGMMVEQLDGELELSREKGTAFTITFPDR